MKETTSLYFIPKTIPCPHCGVRHQIDDLAMAFAAVEMNTFGPNSSVGCDACGGEIVLADMGKYCARIDDVAV